VGHSADDQAETFLLRLIRGAGPRGLAGILPRSGRVVRPLIDIPRVDLRQYTASRQLESREDTSNADLDIPRNRVRHELLPYLQREFSPGISGVLAREAAIARVDEDRLQQEAIDLAASIVLTNRDAVSVDIAALTSLHPALASRVARMALQVRAPGTFIGFDHIERLLRFAREGSQGSAMSLPGQQALHQGSRLVFGPEPPRETSTGQPNSFRFPLSIPGEVMLGDLGWAISAERVERLDWPLDFARDRPGGPGLARSAHVAVALESSSLPLAIRSRRPGDRFRPLGLGHGKKLQDFLVDRKVPREARDSLPLVVDRDDRIVWVVGESVAEDFRVTEPSRAVILLKARRLGGLG
jgi:tRNA(Ile)-lysidine synthase